MPYVNVGAEVNGKRPPSKKALKDAIREAPGAVYFDGTSDFTPGDYTLATIPAGTKLSVVGPDPYKKRSWYATVEVVNGKVKVS